MLRIVRFLSLCGIGTLIVIAFKKSHIPGAMGHIDGLPICAGSWAAVFYVSIFALFGVIFIFMLLASRREKILRDQIDIQELIGKQVGGLKTVIENIPRDTTTLMKESFSPEE
jgi:hypothetical protein